MASVQVYKNGNHQYVRIVESYRDPVTGNPKIRIIKNLGNLAKLEAEEPGIVDRLKREFQEKREKRNEENTNQSLAFIDHFIQSTQHEEAVLCNYGYLVYKSIWDQFNLDYFFKYRQSKTKIGFPTKDIAQMLVYQRLLNPSFKKNAYETMDKLFGIENGFDLHHIYRSLDFFAEQKENLEVYLNKRLSETMERDLSVCFYVVTTYYFESQKADDLKKFGFSKDEKFNEVQVVMGLLIDSYGIPISFELFPGNTSEFSTLEPVLVRLKEEYGLNQVIIVADRGLNSRKNLAFIRSLGYDYVMAYKIKSASQDIKSQVTDLRDYTVLNGDMMYKEILLNQRIKLDGHGEYAEFTDKFVLSYSKKRAQKDAADRERLVKKAEKLQSSPGMLKKGGKKYVQLSFDDFDVDINEEKIEDDSKYDGFYGYVSSDHRLLSQDIMSIYHSLWKIEESFRVMKSHLETRPQFVWTESSIKGHFVTCYLALVIQRYVEHLLREEDVYLSTGQIQESLSSANVSVFKREKVSDLYIKNKANENFSQILKALKLAEIPNSGRITQIKL